MFQILVLLVSVTVLLVLGTHVVEALPPHNNAVWVDPRLADAKKKAPEVTTMGYSGYVWYNGQSYDGGYRGRGYGELSRGGYGGYRGGYGEYRGGYGGYKGGYEGYRGGSNNGKGRNFLKKFKKG